MFFPHPSPPFWPEVIFKGEGRGCILNPPWQDFYTPPPSFIQRLKKRVLQKLPAMLFYHCLVVRKGSMRVRQRDAWFKTLAVVMPMRHKARKS